MKITFTINHSLAIEAVKSETYIKGSIDEAANQNATKLRFNETAGDISVHERKLEKDLPLPTTLRNMWKTSCSTSGGSPQVCSLRLSLTR